MTSGEVVVEPRSPLSGEVYTVVIRGGSVSSLSSYRISGSTTDGTYRVDWSTVLPKKYDKFQLRTYFRDCPDADFTLNGESSIWVECSAFSKPNFFDNKSSGRSSLVAFAPITLYYNNATTTIVPYHETPASHPPMMVNYPTENIFTVKLVTSSGATIDSTNLTEWILVLTFSPIS